jgi:hypothetical protein
MIASPVLAQEQQGTDRGRDRGGNPSGDRGGDRGGRGNFDPAAMRERFTGMIKEQMGATDEEWKVIEPKLTKVMDARRDSGGFGRGGPGGFGRDRNRDDSSANAQTDASPVQAASRELRNVLDDKNATPEQIAAKLTALREAKEKSKTTLASAQKDLKEVLTQRQEAVLVMFGMLD